MYREFMYLENIPEEKLEDLRNLKKCTDCKHYNSYFGNCKNPNLANPPKYIFTFESGLTEIGSHVRCSDARRYESKCGAEAKYFEEKGKRDE